MNSIRGNVSTPRDGLALARFFAVILLSLAALFGLATAIAAVSMLTGDRRAIGVTAAVGTLVWVLAWLGMLLWSGRSIPKWFISAFGIGIFAIPVVAVLAKGTWMEALALLGMSIPTLLQLRSILRDYPGKPSGPKEFDELA